MSWGFALIEVTLVGSLETDMRWLIKEPTFEGRGPDRRHVGRRVELSEGGSELVPNVTANASGVGHVARVPR